MCNSINIDHAKASDRSNDQHYDYASDIANDRTRRVMIMIMLILMIMIILRSQGSG
jgi:hypothetical protein